MKMGKGVQYLHEDMYYVSFKKHKCPNCQTILKTVKVSQTVKKDSPEAKNYDFDFSVSGTRFKIDEITVVSKQFECPYCQMLYTIDEIKKSEGYYPEDYDAETEKAKQPKRNKTRKIVWYIIALLIFIILGVLHKGFTIYL